MKKISTYPVEFYRKLSLRSFKKEWRWKIVATNGKIVGASTEGFINKADCEHNAILVANSIQHGRRS